MFRTISTVFLALFALFALCSCSHEMTILPAFPAGSVDWNGAALAGRSIVLPRGGECRLRIDSVRDTRVDPESAGDLGGEAVRFADTAGWVSAALNSLGRDPAIHIVTNNSEADLVLDVEIVKAYVETITVEKTARVALRVHSSGRGVAARDDVYTGSDSSPNWVGSRAETEGALNDALTKVVRQIDQDMVARCSTATPNGEKGENA